MQFKIQKAEGRIQAYDAVIYPHPQVVHRKLLPLLEQAGANLMSAFGTPERTDRNKTVSLPANEIASGSDDVVKWLRGMNLPHAVEAPPSSWASLSFVKHGAIVTLAPARHGWSYEGTVSYAGRSVEIGESSGLTRVVFREDGEPEVV